MRIQSRLIILSSILLIASSSLAYCQGANSIDESRLASEIDRLIERRWDLEKLQPAPLSGDSEFLRRVSLDLAGRIPASYEVLKFLEDPAQDKRRRCIDRLLSGPTYPSHMARTWREILVPEASGDSEAQFFSGDFEVWLRSEFAKGSGYDQIVRQLMTASVEDGIAMFNRGAGKVTKPLPFGFLVAKRARPENLAASTSRLFLGMRMDCAQCHDHPFAKWKREDFWGFAAFFAGLELEIGGDGIPKGRDDPYRREILIPGGQKTVLYRFVDGTAPLHVEGVSSRSVLADWLTSRKNPYFSRATVNRVWSQLFGIGLVDPVDDMDLSNEPSHPELLELLSEQFSAHQFDLKFLIRSITLSKTYQRSSRMTAGPKNHDNERDYARMSIRGLSPAQIFDSLHLASGLAPKPVPAFDPDSPRRHFFDQFAVQDERAIDRQMSMHQMLLMMNGYYTSEATSLESGRSLRAIIDAPFLDTDAKIEALYLAALSRRPAAEELGRSRAFVSRHRREDGVANAFADIFWSLVVGPEFMLNH